MALLSTILHNRKGRCKSTSLLAQQFLSHRTWFIVFKTATNEKLNRPWIQRRRGIPNTYRFWSAEFEPVIRASPPRYSARSFPFKASSIWENSSRRQQKAPDRCTRWIAVRSTEDSSSRSNIMRTTNNSSTRTTSYPQTLAENSQWAESGYSSQSLEQFLNKVPTISHQFLQIPERRCVNNLSTVHLLVSFPWLEK
jgi:hypothetical protein